MKQWPAGTSNLASRRSLLAAPTRHPLHATRDRPNRPNRPTPNTGASKTQPPAAAAQPPHAIVMADAPLRGGAGTRDP